LINGILFRDVRHSWPLGRVARPGGAGALWWPLAGVQGGVGRFLYRWGPGASTGGCGRVGVRSLRARLQAGRAVGTRAYTGAISTRFHTWGERRPGAGAVQRMRGQGMPTEGGG